MMSFNRGVQDNVLAVKINAPLLDSAQSHNVLSERVGKGIGLLEEESALEIHEDVNIVYCE